MIICSCAGLSDAVVRRVIAEGARTVEEVRDRCGAGRSCGVCRGAIDVLIKDFSQTTVPQDVCHLNYLRIIVS